MERVVTIERHIIDQERVHPAATGVFSDLLYDIALAAKLIARETSRAGLAEILGLAGRINIQGEQQMKLDVFANETIIRMNSYTGRLAVMASEETEDIIPVPPEYKQGKYVLIFDPLDGSTNVDVNAAIGTIFGIFRRVTPEGPGTLEDVLQKGRYLVAAGYISYGPSTMLVYSTGNGVHGFTLDPGVGEFLLSHPNLHFPNKPKYYSVNQGYEKYWSEGVSQYIKWIQGFHSEKTGPELSSRYTGTLVADFHRILLEGGIYCYPIDSRQPGKSQGKLRLLVEAIPLSFLAEQAGGRGSDGVQNISEIQPGSIHQRTPLFIGNNELVRKAVEFIQRYG